MSDALGLRTVVCEWMDRLVFCGDSKTIILMQLKAIKNHLEDKIKEIEESK